MRARVMGKAHAALAALLAFVFAFSLLGIPAPALAEPADNPGNEATTSTPLTLSGVDFMQPTADGWEILRADNSKAGDTLYIDVAQKVDGQKKILVKDMAYTIPEDDETNVKTAHIVTFTMTKKDSAGNPIHVQLVEQFGQSGQKDPVYVFDVRTQKRGGTSESFTMYPVYANIFDANKQLVQETLLGVRTVKSTVDPSDVTTNIGAGSVFYRTVKNEGSADSQTISYKLTAAPNGCDVAFENNKYVVTYDETKQGSITGTITYVDTEGNVVRTDEVSGITDKTTIAEFEKSFFSKGKYYRALVNGKNEAALTIANANYVVPVIEIKNMNGTGAYEVTINYREKAQNANGEFTYTHLWGDEIDVKGEGYWYTLPTTFSMASKEGVELYTLEGVVGDEQTTPGTDQEVAALGDTQWGNPILLNGKTDDTLFAKDENGNRYLNANYKPSKAEGKVTFTVVEMNGATGEQLDRKTFTVTPEDAATYVPAEEVTKYENMVSWVGNPEEITYTWGDLANGVDLMQYVYYVPKDYVPGDAYDITVQYVNIANGSVINTETVNVDPEITNYVEVQGVERFTSEDGNEYVRLAGQETGVRHTYFSPDRTYTIYYRDVDDVINANTTITRTQIIETTRTVTVPGGGITAAPVPVATPVADAPAADAGVAPGAGTTIINDDDNPLAGLAGQDTATERSIADNENPLASGAAGMNWGLIAGIGFGVIAVAGIVAYALLRRKRNKNEQNA